LPHRCVQKRPFEFGGKEKGWVKDRAETREKPGRSVKGGKGPPLKVVRGISNPPCRVTAGKNVVGLLEAKEKKRAEETG